MLDIGFANVVIYYHIILGLRMKDLSCMMNKLIGSYQIMNINGDMNTNVKSLFRTSRAALILKYFFSRLCLCFCFMFVIRKLSNVSTCTNFQTSHMLFCLMQMVRYSKE